MAGSLLTTFLVGGLQAYTVVATTAQTHDRSSSPEGDALAGVSGAVRPVNAAVTSSVLASRAVAGDPSLRSPSDGDAGSLAPCLVPTRAGSSLLLDERVGVGPSPPQDDDLPTPHDELAPVLRAVPTRAGPASRAG